MLRVLTALFLAALALPAEPAKRSAAAILEFKRHSPCPSTGARRGACPGFVVDHIDPLCNGGADASHNMQWQSIRAARRKDAEERLLCRENKRPK